MKKLLDKNTQRVDIRRKLDERKRVNRLKFDPDKLRAMIKTVHMDEGQFFMALAEHCAGAGRIINMTYWKEWLDGSRQPSDYVSYMKEVIRAKGMDHVKLIDFFTEVEVKQPQSPDGSER